MWHEVMNDNESPLTKRRKEEAQTLDEYRQTLRDQPQPQIRALGHLTCHTLELASRISFAVQEDLAERPDTLAAIAESRDFISMFIQLQRQAGLNEDLSARRSAGD